MYRFRLVLNKFIFPSLWLLSLGLCLLAPFYPNWVAQIYTSVLFHHWTLMLRFLFGWIPFAIGELVYLIVVIILITNIIRWFTSLKNINYFSDKLRFVIFKFTWLFIKLYVVFHLIWGLNYLQPDPTNSFGLIVQAPENAPIALSQMNELTNELIQELNHSKVEMEQFKSKKMDLEQIIDGVQMAYAKKASSNASLKFHFYSTKKAIFPGWGDYMGYLAFYQPITGEAIIRSDLPLYTQAYTIAHEMAHQLGYASETEANFIAYVVAEEAGDPFFRYSMLLQMFTYAQDAQLLLIAGTKDFDAWKAQIEKNKAALAPAVLQDRANIRAFFAARAGKQIGASTKLYDQFLIWNQQAAGLDSYADVLKWVRAYRLKTGSSTSYSQ